MEEKAKHGFPQNSELIYGAIFNAANDAIFVHDIETGQIVDVNEKACEMYCYPKEEMLKLDVEAMSAGARPYSQEEALALIKKASDGTPQLFEWLAKDKAGRLFWVEVNLKRAVIAGKYRLLAIVRDITERKKSEEALLKRDYQLEVLSRTSQHINTILEASVIMRTVVAAAMELVDATAGTSGLFVGGGMVFSEYNKEGSLVPVNYVFKDGNGIPGLVTKMMKPYISNDAEHDPNVILEKRMTFGLYNLINMPILNSRAELLGCFEVHNKKGRLDFDAQDVFMLQGLAASAAVALENAKVLAERRLAENERDALNKELLKTNEKLKQSALKDPQTGLYSHHYLSETLDRELVRSKRYGHPLSVIMMDIDYFKSINDVYGHEFGDVVLKQLASQLVKMVRRYDIVIRFGGEEFVIVSPSTDRAKAMILAQRILDAVNLYSFGSKEHSVKLKLSAAVTSYPDDTVTNGTALTNLADKILDKVKEKGGNKVYSSVDLARTKDRALLAREIEPTDVRYLKEKIEKLTKQGKQNLIESIFAFAKTIELKDHYTGEHVESTVHFATEIGRALDLPPEELENVKEAAILHDLGKIGINDKVLLKKSKLTKKEFEEIKKHPQIAADIIRPIQFMHDIIPLILYHHERWDSKGYPAGLKGPEIPLGARIIALADVYQALISNRPYRRAYSKKDAMAIIKKGSGTQFDPEIVDVFLRILKKENNKRHK